MGRKRSIFAIACMRLFFLIHVNFSEATFDVNEKQLQMVADSLSMDECRKLSESLHQDGYVRDHIPSGKSEPHNVSCLRLLQYWDTHEGKFKSVQLLVIRLKQLGHYDIANQLSASVSHEKVYEVHELFLDDPFKNKIHKNSPRLTGNSFEEDHEPAARKSSSSWTSFRMFEIALLTVLFSIFLAFTILALIRFCSPYSFARMRATFYKNMFDSRPAKEELFFIL
ncbi:uncharacterized protein [Parasteatoda tepidariorum]|uniref:uncharacterized protein n=1 Tax=Parasteatoda tepidariorum TaxID=114398 RepID=UPI001C722748|nr:uncharacterized protein LOC107455767 [Parasteatoda tepidariorum]